MANRIQLRRDTGANWASVNPVLAQGEVGIVTDAIPIQIKVGNGVTAWNSLSYVATGNMDVAGSTLDDLVDGTTYKRIAAALAATINDETRLPTAAGTTVANNIGAQTGATTLAKLQTLISSIDNIPDGTTYKRVTASEKTTVTTLDTEVGGASALSAWNPPRVAILDPDRFHLERISGGRASIRYSESGRVPIEVVWVEAFNCAEVSPDFCRSRANSTEYSIGQLLMANGQLYEVTTAGTTGASAPTYPSTVGQSVADGTATLTLIQNSYDDLYPAFSVAGTKKAGLWYSRFLCDVVSGKPRSIAGQLPSYATIDQIRSYATAFGGGASPMTYWDYEALALDAFRKGTTPVGNTYYGRSHKTVEGIWGGIRGDLKKNGDPTGSGVTRGGSAGPIWTHDRSLWGVHDFVGNYWRWVDGVKWMDGQIYIHAVDNDPTLLTTAGEGSWIATGIFLNSPVAGDDAGSNDLGYPNFVSAVTNYTASVTPPRTIAEIQADTRDLDYAGQTWGSVVVSSGIDSVDAAMRLLAFRMCILPKIRSSGPAPFTTQEGYLWIRNNGERFALRAGRYNLTSHAGPKYVSADYRRSSMNAFALVFR